MNEANEHPDNDPRVRAPRQLADDLAALYGSGVPVPPEVDEAIMGMARRGLVRGRRPLIIRWVAGAAAAAAILMVFWMLDMAERRARTPFPPADMVAAERRAPAPSPAAQVAMREDVDRSGRVDILDAFALARHVEADLKPRQEWDMNGDGIVNRVDVDTVALAAVSLQRGTLQ